MISSFLQMKVTLPCSLTMTGVNRLSRGTVDHSPKTSQRKMEKAQAEYLEDIGQPLDGALSFSGFG